MGSFAGGTEEKRILAKDSQVSNPEPSEYEAGGTNNCTATFSSFDGDVTCRRYPIQNLKQRSFDSTPSHPS
jgi:hypothetical protein